jgi:hypothetical protein
MALQEHLQEAEVGLGELGVGQDVVEGDLQTHLERHIQSVLQRLVIIESEDPKVDIAP